MTSTIKKLRVDRLICDQTVQRPLDSRWVEKKLAEGFDKDGLGVPVVSHRADDTYHIADGQHRIALMCAAGRGEETLLCQVHEGLTREQEAFLFRVLNDRRAVQPITKFLVAIVEGDPKIVRLNKTLERHGWSVAWTKNKGNLAAVSALIWLCDLQGGDQFDAVDMTLQVVTAAWGHDPDGVRAEIIKGIGSILVRHGDAVQIPTLVKRLALMEGGPSELVSRAKYLKRLRKSRLSDAVSEAAISDYNKGKKSSALPQWDYTKGWLFEVAA